MLATIEELEREIDQFHKNVKESNELLGLLSAVVASSRDQTTAFEAEMSAVRTDLSSLPLEISCDFEKRTASLLDSIENAQREHMAAIAAAAEEVSGRFVESADLMHTSSGRFSAAADLVSEKMLAFPQELGESLAKRAEELLTEIRSANEAYESSVRLAIDSCIEQIAHSEKMIEAVPAAFSVQVAQANENHLTALRASQAEHLDALAASREDIDAKAKELLAALCSMDADHLAALRTAQDEHLRGMSASQDAYSAQTQSFLEEIRGLPAQMETSSKQQYDCFMADLRTTAESGMARVAKVEEALELHGERLESKYDSFIAKLDDTNVSQLYKHSQDMEKSLNAKLTVALIGVAISIAVSIASLLVAGGLI